jgi:predicted PurR-regulated permease PerM
VENRDLAAGLAVVIVAIALVVPVVMLGFHIAQQAAEGLDQLQEMAKSGSWRASLDQHPKIAAIESWIEARFDVGQGAMQIATKVQQYVTTVLKSSFWGGLQLAIALYSLFFFFRDRKHVLGALRGLVPLSNREVDEVFENVRVMVRATIYGNVVTSLLQGTLGGLMFWILGLPAPLLWGVAMFVLSLVPTLGSPLVWVPMAIFLAASGAWGKALILAGWGVFVVGTIDNLLYPLLVGKDIRMHTLAVFLALLGGMFIFGAAGLVLGPVILAITLALIDILRRRTAHGRPAEAPT